MCSLRVVDADDRYFRYVSLCTHVDSHSPDQVKAAERRLRWLKDQIREGRMAVKVAINGDGKPLGFMHLIPIEFPTSGMVGRDLMVIPCLTLDYPRVYAKERGTGVGRVLVEAAEQEARSRGLKGLAVRAYEGDSWFMPSGFFEKLGFRRVGGSEIWVKRWTETDVPSLRPSQYSYVPVLGKVVIDCFWSPFCLTVCQEIDSTRQVAEEFGDRVVLREYRSDDPDVAARYGMGRALFINGERRDWGYAAPKEELRRVVNSKSSTS